MRQFLAAYLFILFTMNAQAQKPKVLLNHIAIYVEDLAKSTSFYTNVLHLDTVANPFNDGRHTWFSVGGKLTLHVVQGAKQPVTQYRSTHTCFSIGDLDAFIQQLNKAGIPYEDSKGNKAAITTRADGIRQIYFTDPDGYWIEMNDEKI